MTNSFSKWHTDVTKWKHFPRYWLFVWGIHRSPVDSLTKASDAELWCFLWANGWANNRDADDLRRHRAHHDVNVMETCPFGCCHTVWGSCAAETFSKFKKKNLTIWKNWDMRYGERSLVTETVLYSFSSLPGKYFFCKGVLGTLHHIRIWQVSQQPSSSDTCLTCMGYHTCIQCFDGSEQNRKSINGWELLSTLHPRALSYYSDLTLSQAFQLMAAQLSKKAALPLAKILATASCIHWWYVHPCTGIRWPRECMLPYVTWNTMLFISITCLQQTV